MRRPTPCRSIFAVLAPAALLLGSAIVLAAPDAMAAAKPSPARAVAAKSAKPTPPKIAKALSQSKAVPQKKAAVAAAASRKPTPAQRSTVKTLAVLKVKPAQKAAGKPAAGRQVAAARTIAKGRAEAPLYRTASLAPAAEKRLTVPVGDDDTLIDVLARESVAVDDLIAAVDAFEDIEERNPLGRGDRIELVLGAVNEDGEHTLTALRIARVQGGDVALVRAADGSFTASGAGAGPAGVMVTMTGRVAQGWRQALAAADVPADVADEVDRLLALDPDLPRPLPRGAAFEILAERRDGGRSGPAHAVRYVGVQVAGHDHRIYRYMPHDGPAGYFDEAGRSIAPLSLALPIADGRLTSDFGWRRHPKLRKRMFHRGIDLAAPIGTPIVASADGIVEWAGWRGAYGRYVRLTHGNGVSTGYGHLQEYSPTVVPGASVRQGEVIGYVGSSGRSTGPHVDFSVLVDGRPVNPMQALMPTPRDLAGPELVAFREHVAQIHGLAQLTP
ncbi:MAG: peptidoglycan DD-metalloendopeptidase family protein [Alphaproteobacteria bacterium]